MSNNKKAQIQMGESIAIIIIIMILIIFALVFYSKIKEVDISEKKILFQDLDLIELSQIIYSLPEIQCSFAEVVDYGCIDLLKYYELAKIINESFKDDKIQYFYYRQLFGNTKISLETIKDEKTVNLYNSNRTWTSKSVMNMPIIAYNPINDTKLFATLNIEKYD
ncbi:MAG: hypothetical protein KKF89_05215 [Nanoarchaeota archaeon]|nr:hypothetical protein [Nanoarchaeota archaeon]MBU1855094.1 hypothetical protein [Nanoarchaeota archaeon]